MHTHKKQTFWKWDAKWQYFNPNIANYAESSLKYGVI